MTRVRKDYFFRLVMRNKQRIKVVKDWHFDGFVDGRVYDNRIVPVDGFLAFVGPGSANYKCVVVYDEGGGRYIVCDQWGGQLYSYTVELSPD